MSPELLSDLSNRFFVEAITWEIDYSARERTYLIEVSRTLAAKAGRTR